MTDCDNIRALLAEWLESDEDMGKPTSTPGRRFVDGYFVDPCCEGRDCPLDDLCLAYRTKRALNPEGGFTQEDVALLRSMADYYDRMTKDIGRATHEPTEGTLLRRLADRIAALLPKR